MGRGSNHSPKLSATTVPSAAWHYYFCLRILYITKKGNRHVVEASCRIDVPGKRGDVVGEAHVEGVGPPCGAYMRLFLGKRNRIVVEIPQRIKDLLNRLGPPQCKDPFLRNYYPPFTLYNCLEPQYSWAYGAYRFL